MKSAVNLRALNVTQRVLTDEFVLSLDDIPLISSKLERFRYEFIAATAYTRDPTSAFVSFQRQLLTATFGESLTYLWLDFRRFDNRPAADFRGTSAARRFPNLRHFGMLWYTPDQNEVKEIYKFLPHLRRLTLSEDFSGFSLQQVPFSIEGNIYSYQDVRLITNTTSDIFLFGKTWLDELVTNFGIGLVRVLCSRTASIFELAVQGFYSIEIFKYCFEELKLPESFDGEHSAVASLISGPYFFIRHRMAQYKHHPSPRQLCDFVKPFLRKYGNSIDLAATTWRLPSQRLYWNLLRDGGHRLYMASWDRYSCAPDSVAKCNPLQCALLSANGSLFDIVKNRIYEYCFDYYTWEDLFLGKDSNLIVSALVDETSLPSQILPILKLLFLRSEEIARLSKNLINKPVEGRYPIDWALSSAKNSRAAVPLWQDYGADIKVCKSELLTRLTTKGFGKSEDGYFKRLWNAVGGE